ncbi:Gfo/Idh/MocA family oxidoreductase [Cryobacterium sp. Y62]|uniref:Gfo/Idh/MocA family oxidoreductase n=1 Tax=Cryobacterium sp. Y62 TaxID=2048284 RepID=UPI000CE574CC|nr:Gfo/Idh/MocA family oxidoreductase [Cryobacterium sp. Y62]
MSRKRVITYGTFDLFHPGHRRLLERARALGDHLTVGVTTDSYDSGRGKLNVHESLARRIEGVRKSGLADEIIIEEYEGQKVTDAQKYNISVFAIGSDWAGKFDYLSDYCEVIYLDRTPGISSTELRSSAVEILKLGIVGAGRIATRFVAESKYVSGVNVEGVFTPSSASASTFAFEHTLGFAESNYESFLNRVDAVYIASPHLAHYEQARQALLRGRHVLCEKPMTLESAQASDLYDIARERNLLLMEAVKTAYSPGFMHLVSMARSGKIGTIKNVEATFTKLVGQGGRELEKAQAGGSVTELASYPLLAITKLLGTNPVTVSYDSLMDPDSDVDVFTKIRIRYAEAMATATVGLGVKAEGSLTVSGTTGYIYAPAPWWLTKHYEVRRENPRDNESFNIRFDGDGLRYELADFVSMINFGVRENYKLTRAESLYMNGIISSYHTLPSGPSYDQE